MANLPTFSPMISTGNILTIGSIIVAAGIGWGQLSSQIAAEQAMRTAIFVQVENKVDANVRTQASMEARMRALEEQTARIDERFTMLITLMSELKSDVSTLTRRGIDEK